MLAMILGSFAFGVAGIAAAQLPVPQVQLPVQVPSPLPETVRGVGDAVRDLPRARALRIDNLRREHRAQLDTDPRGELVVRSEVVAIGITEQALARALAADFLVRRTRLLEDLDLSITVLQTPEGWSARRGLARLRKLDPEGTYDYNHVYLQSALVSSQAAEPNKDVAAPRAPSGRVGLIDSGVETNHVALRGNVVHRNGCDGRALPAAHGTAVASLLAGGTPWSGGAASKAELFAADVYCGMPAGGAVDAVAAAFGWMARERVAVVNVSLVGPRNVLLERAVKLLVTRGHLIVAAVGNDGPAAAPLYPAAYDGVIGVTAVDAKRRVLLEACRGKHLDFAAPGADLTAAGSGVDEFVSIRGTSFAAPLVARLLAAELPAPDPAASTRLVSELATRAVDLGPRGRDDIYGAGFVDGRQPLAAGESGIKLKE